MCTICRLLPNLNIPFWSSHSIIPSGIIAKIRPHSPIQSSLQQSYSVITSSIPVDFIEGSLIWRSQVFWYNSWQVQSIKRHSAWTSSGPNSLLIPCLIAFSQSKKRGFPKHCFNSGLVSFSHSFFHLVPWSGSRAMHIRFNDVRCVCASLNGGLVHPWMGRPNTHPWRFLPSWMISQSLYSMFLSNENKSSYSDSNNTLSSKIRLMVIGASLARKGVYGKCTMIFIQRTNTHMKTRVFPLLFVLLLALLFVLQVARAEHSGITDAKKTFEIQTFMVYVGSSWAFFLDDQKLSLKALKSEGKSSVTLERRRGRKRCI